jgi:hypothetical protein
MMTIEHWTQRVEPDPNPKGPFVNRPVRGEYERTNTTSYPNGGGHASRKEWLKHLRRMSEPVLLCPDGSAIIELGRQYGIHSYQRITFEVTA